MHSNSVTLVCGKYWHNHYHYSTSSEYYMMDFVVEFLGVSSYMDIKEAGYESNIQHIENVNGLAPAIWNSDFFVIIVNIIIIILLSNT